MKTVLGYNEITYSDRALSQKLEQTEGRFNAAFVSAHLEMFPDSGVEWKEINGTYALFDGVESPLTQTFGLGLLKEVSSQVIEELEEYYQQFSAPIFHEISPLADPHMEILFNHGYQPIEQSSILFKTLSNEKLFNFSKIKAEPMLKNEKEACHTWALTSARGWCGEWSDLSEFMYNFAKIGASSQGVVPFFANLNGKPISTGMLYVDNEVALLAGDSTIAEGRKLGAQNALIEARLNHAIDCGCTLAMITTSPGSGSQRNAEKNGFRLAYTRTKWKKRT